MNRYIKFLSLILCAALLLCTTACDKKQQRANVVNLTESAELVNPKALPRDERFVGAQQDFAIELFVTEMAKQKENLSIAPVSLNYVLSMVANGATGEALEEFQKVLMRDIPIDDWNSYMYSYNKEITNYMINDQKYDFSREYRGASSIWINNETDKISVKKDFLDKTKSIFNSDVYSANFGGSDFIEKLNGWVKDNTDGKIEELTDSVDKDTKMYLANTVYFEQMWMSTHSLADVKEDKFYSYGGKESNVKYMFNKQQEYFMTDNAVGVVKELSNAKFLAIMPNEDVDIMEYIASFNGEKLRNITANIKNDKVVEVRLPYFNINSDLDLSESLQKMGLDKAYTNVSSFGNISDNIPLSLGATKQKCNINVDNTGVTVVAATGQEVIAMGLTLGDDIIQVTFDRPFVYVILNEFDIPMFIGAVTKL